MNKRLRKKLGARFRFYKLETFTIGGGNTTPVHDETVHYVVDRRGPRIADIPVLQRLRSANTQP